MARRADPVRIRRVEREDLDVLFALDQKCFRPGIAYSKIELQYFLFHPRSVSIIAENEGGVAGFAILELHAERGRLVGHIITIDIAETERRRGVGRLLMQMLHDHCRKLGALAVRLEVAVDNDGAQAFYRGMGFEETGRLRWFYVGNVDALQMELKLSAG